jgi:hypothetical protein
MYNNWKSGIRLPDGRLTPFRATQMTRCWCAMMTVALCLPANLLQGEERRPSVAPWAPSARKEGQFETDFRLPGINNRQGLPPNSSPEVDSPSTLPSKAKPNATPAPDEVAKESALPAKDDIAPVPSKNQPEPKSGNNSIASSTATEDKKVRPAPRLKPALRIPMGPTVELAEQPRLLPLADASPPAAKSTTSQAPAANSTTANKSSTAAVMNPAAKQLAPPPSVGNTLSNRPPATALSATVNAPPTRPRDLPSAALPLATIPSPAIPASQPPAPIVSPSAGGLVQRPRSGESRADSPAQPGNTAVVAPVPDSKAPSSTRPAEMRLAERSTSSGAVQSTGTKAGQSRGKETGPTDDLRPLAPSLSTSSQSSARSTIAEHPTSRQAPPSAPPPRLVSSAVVEVVATPLANPARSDNASVAATGSSTPSPLSPSRQAVSQNAGAHPTELQPKSPPQSAPSAPSVLPHVSSAFQTATTTGGPPAVKHPIEPLPAFLGSSGPTVADNSSRSNRVSSPATTGRPNHDSTNVRGQPVAGTQLTAAHFETPAEKSANLKAPHAASNPERQAAAEPLGQTAAQADNNSRAPHLSAQSPFVASQGPER